MQPRRAYHLGRLAGLELYATPSALVSSLILWGERELHRAVGLDGVTERLGHGRLGVLDQEGQSVKMVLRSRVNSRVDTPVPFWVALCV
jgi:hypothetical protein